jgi:glucose-1-phosphate thymidylyltransferase
VHLKGIILAGGSGTRLSPITKVISKQLIPIYDKPMIYYPLSSLMMAGIREILVISTPHDLPLFKRLLGSGCQWGLDLSYAEQPKPEGLAQALIIAEDFLEASTCCLILGDNIFYGHGLPEKLKKGTELDKGGMIFGYYVSYPQAYGVIEFDKDGNALSLEEKPEHPKSNFVIPGIYFYDSQASSFAKSLKPSHRGELEITDLNKIYLNNGSLKVERLGRGIAWLDTGTHTTMMQASNFIRTIIERQGLQIGCPEEIAFRQQWIGEKEILQAVQENQKNDYGSYLRRLLKGL